MGAMLHIFGPNMRTITKLFKSVDVKIAFKTANTIKNTSNQERNQQSKAEFTIENVINVH
jgi:hypothetical protein